MFTLCVCVCVCSQSQASVSGSALSITHGELCLSEEELHTALQLHCQELQPHIIPQVKQAQVYIQKTTSYLLFYIFFFTRP